MPGSSDRQHRAAGEAKGIKAASSRAFLPAVAPRGESSSPGARRRFSLSLRRGCARLQTSIPASASLTPVPSRRSPQTQESPAHGEELVRKNHGSNGTVYVICSVEGRACVQHVAAFAVLVLPVRFFSRPCMFCPFFVLRFLPNNELQPLPGTLLPPALCSTARNRHPSDCNTPRGRLEALGEFHTSRIPNLLFPATLREGEIYRFPQPPQKARRVAASTIAVSKSFYYIREVTAA